MIDYLAMIANGIYVRSAPDYLVSELTGSLRGLRRIETDRPPPPVSSGSRRSVVLSLDCWDEGWCYIQMDGDPDGIAVVAEFLTGHKSLETVLVWECDRDAAEYKYAFFKRGKVLEQFEVKGPALESVNFRSELRQVQLRDLIQTRDFAEGAFKWFGLRAETEQSGETRPVRLVFSLPPKRSILKSLLGALAGEE